MDLESYDKIRITFLGKAHIHPNKNSDRALRENLRKIQMALLDCQNQRIYNLKRVSLQSLKESKFDF